MDPKILKGIRDALNAQLPGPRNINIGFGIELYDALKDRGDIFRGRFHNPAFKLGVGPEFLDVWAYGGAHPAFRSEDLPPQGFLLGMGGV